MGWDIAAAALAIGLAAVVISMCIALADIIEPGTLTQCSECRHMMINTRKQSPALCYHCRHDHHGHLAVGMARLHVPH